MNLDSAIFKCHGEICVHMETSAEIVFAQRLASNEKTIRDRALKKLRKYISARASKTGKHSPQCTHNVLTLDIVTNCGTTTTEYYHCKLVQSDFESFECIVYNCIGQVAN